MSLARAVNWVSPRQDAPVHDARALDLMVRLASVIALPIGRLDSEALGLAPLTAAEIDALARLPAFAGPLNAAAAAHLGLGAVPLSSGLFERLPSAPKSRLCVLLATGTKETLTEAALFLAAVAMHRDIVAMPMKEQRSRLAAALGPDAFGVATREAPLQYRALADLGPHARIDLARDAETLRSQFVDFGLALTFGFIAACESELLGFLRRCRPSLAPEAPVSGALLSPVHCAMITRLCRRRFPQWSPIIG